MYAPEAFVTPWDDGFSKIYTVGCVDMFGGMKAMSEWNNEYVFEDSINVVGHTAVQTSNTIHEWCEAEVFEQSIDVGPGTIGMIHEWCVVNVWEQGYEIGHWAVEAAKFTYYWYTYPVEASWVWYTDLETVALVRHVSHPAPLFAPCNHIYYIIG